jgi:phospholipase/carboxylesterase
MSDLGFTHVFEPGKGGPTLLLLHGTGGDERDLVGLGRQLAPGAALLSPRGKVLEHGVSPRFFRRLAVGRLDIFDLLVRTDELAEFVGQATERYELDPGRVIALGFSNGANIAVSLLLRHPSLLHGAALLRPMLPYEPSDPPALEDVDVLVAAGSHDPYSPPQQSARLVQVLRDGGARVTVHTEPGAGHGLTQNDVAQTARWMARVAAPVAS